MSTKGERTRPPASHWSSSGTRYTPAFLTCNAIQRVQKARERHTYEVHNARATSTASTCQHMPRSHYLCHRPAPCSRCAQRISRQHPPASQWRGAVLKRSSRTRQRPQKQRQHSINNQICCERHSATTQLHTGASRRFAARELSSSDLSASVRMQMSRFNEPARAWQKLVLPVPAGAATGSTVRRRGDDWCSVHNRGSSRHRTRRAVQQVPSTVRNAHVTVPLAAGQELRRVCLEH
jgi:hypothetical protein